MNIDAEKLIAEIERWRDKAKEKYNESTYSMGRCDALAEFRNYIVSLQQEQPDNWDDEYREDELLTRFAFYTYKDEDGVLYLSNVFVEEASRNKGFGAKILQAAEKVAETIGAITICLKAKRNSQANDWYRKHGYGYLTFEGEYDWLEKNLEYLKSKQEQPEVFDTVAFQRGVQEGRRLEREDVLTIADIELLHAFLYAVKNNKHGAFTFTRLTDEQYEEILRRFNKVKE